MCTIPCSMEVHWIWEPLAGSRPIGSAVMLVTELVLPKIWAKGGVTQLLEPDCGANIPPLGRAKDLEANNFSFDMKGPLGLVFDSGRNFEEVKMFTS